MHLWLVLASSSCGQRWSSSSINKIRRQIRQSLLPVQRRLAPCWTDASCSLGMSQNVRKWAKFYNFGPNLTSFLNRLRTNQNTLHHHKRIIPNGKAYLRPFQQPDPISFNWCASKWLKLPFYLSINGQNVYLILLFFIFSLAPPNPWAVQKSAGIYTFASFLMGCRCYGMPAVLVQCRRVWLVACVHKDE